MRSHGFVWTPLDSGHSSGGRFASGEFRRGTRRLELHFRYSLGLVQYHVGNLALSHEDYMWAVIGQRWASHYPGFSQEPLDGFRHLLADLQQFGSSFMSGSDQEFAGHIQRAESLKRNTPRFPI